MTQALKKAPIRVFLAGICTFLAATAPFANELQKSEFDKLDKNQDGVLTVKEVSQHNQIREAWGKMDLDESGAIDRAEFSLFEVEENELDDLMDPTTKELKEVYK